MTGANILVGEGKRRSSPAPSPESGWQLLAGLGWLFALVAASDLALVWYPFGFGNPDWEISTVSATVDHLPLLTVGLALIFGASVANRKLWTLQATCIGFLILALFVVGSTIMFGRGVGAARQGLTDVESRTNLTRVTTKTIIQAILYSIGFVWIAVKGFKHSKQA